LDAAFAGVGSHVALMMVDEITGEVVDILPEQYKNMEFIVTLKYTGGKLMLRLNNNKGLLYDIKRENGKLVATLEQEGFNIGSNQITDMYDGKIYYSYNGYFSYYDINTKKFTATSQESGGGGSAIDLIKLKDQEKFPGYSYVYTTTANKDKQLELTIYNPETGERVTKFFETQKVPTDLRSIASGPDGRIYSNGYLIGGAGAYTIGSNEPSRQYKMIGQAENMVTVGERIYLGVYPGGSLYMFNPYKETDGKTNPLKLFSLGEAEKQDRPFGMAAQDNIIYIGTLPNYGVLGGDFTIYNTKTFKWEIIKEPIKGQAITCVAANKEYAVGGTTIWGGHGINPSTTSAKLLVYHIETKEYKVVELPRSGIPIVSGLAFDNKGRLWGTAESYLFVYDIEKDEFQYFEVAFPEKNFDNVMVVIDSTMLYNWKDHYMYGMTSRKGFFRVDPDTMEMEFLSPLNGEHLIMGEDGNIYFFVKNSLYVYGDVFIPTSK
ncbi:MAG TPA: hypothetical protein DDZ89_22030, partial [Clostridiales bacterium]|nr:hypothetical protein [Clostridiales bacterium]